MIWNTCFRLFYTLIYKKLLTDAEKMSQLQGLLTARVTGKLPGFS